ncbi:unnamed protein product [Somion occarium]|uniref:Cytochrome P450 n=1 Tax=Somion occarium TaxID=3059160 RepID=A0ABP1DJM9_9APHY
MHCTISLYSQNFWYLSVRNSPPSSPKKTKAAMSKMRKLDSLLRESQRMNGTDIDKDNPHHFKDVTLSTGATVPADSYLGVPLLSIQHDEELYPNPEVFYPWRLSNMREGAEGVKYQYITTSPEYLTFGHGRHACPGRPSAANEIKTMLCHVILYYDVNFENEGVRPQNYCVFMQSYPSVDAKVLFRERHEPTPFHVYRIISFSNMIPPQKCSRPVLGLPFV